MRKDKRKLASFLLAIACVSCAVGGFVVGGKALKETNITAKAETTTCVMSQIGVLNSSTASVIQAYSILETEKPIVDSWSYKFTFEEGSGRGFLYNGEAHTGWTIKQPGRDMYIELGKTAAVGDYVIIDGSFYNADSDTRLSFSCKFQWNGEKWVDYIEEEKPEEDSKYTTYTITKIGANRDSSANVAYVYSLGGDAFPKDQGEWQSVYTPSADASVKLNSEVISVGKIKLPGDLYIPLNVTAVAGDVLTINGGFYNDEKGIMLVLKNCQLQFDGEAWMTVDTEIEDPDPELPEEPDQPEFATYDLGTLTFRDWTADKNHMYLRGTKANGSIPNPDDGSNGWRAEFSWEDGAITVNGEAMKGIVVKYPGEFFISFPKVPKAGDVVTIQGTFYHEATEIAYVVEKSSFTWDGKTWVPALNYTDYAFEVLEIYNTQTQNNSLELTTKDGGAFAQNGTFTLLGGSGKGFLLNGEALEGTGITVSGNKLSVDATFEAKEGDVLTIEGTFYNVGTASRYVIKENVFAYQDGAWKVYESKYAERNLGEVKVLEDGSYADYVYFTPVNSVEIPDCYGAFVCAYGTGVVLNNQAVEDLAIKGFDGGLVVSHSASVKEGDVLTIGGKFVSEVDGVLYFVKDSQFTWNGYAWESVIDYEVKQVGKLVVSGNNTTAGELKTTAGDLKSEAFDLTFESGHGFTVNGKTKSVSVKNAAGIITLTFDEVQVGSIVKIGGTFYNKKYAVKYVIEETEFIWKGKAWTLNYDVVNVGPLKINSTNTNGQDLYLLPANSVQMPASGWSSPLHCADGAYITVNGVQIDMNNTVKVPNNNVFFIRLTSSADGVANGAVVVISGSFPCDATGMEYVIEETVFTYENGAWTNQADTLRTEKLAALSAKFASFSQNDYYATEWSLLQKTYTDAQTAIQAENAKNAIETLFANATALMDMIATKAEWDGTASAIKADAKAELENYKSAALYRESEQAAIASIVAQAKLDIDGAVSWTALYEIVCVAMAKVDVLWTDADWTAAEKIGAAAKEEIVTYKAIEDYFVAEQTVLQDIIAKANADIDGAIGNESAIAEIVAAAKAEMDAVKTADQVEDEQIALLIVKAELEEYKKRSDYNIAEWTQIQTILAQAYAELDEAVGDEEGMAAIVASAKASMDAVPSSGEDSDVELPTDGENSSTNTEKGGKSGCSGVVGGVASGVAVLGIAAALLKKRKEEREN